jgi:hypothetical protein
MMKTQRTWRKKMLWRRLGACHLYKTIIFCVFKPTHIQLQKFAWKHVLCLWREWERGEWKNREKCVFFNSKWWQKKYIKHSFMREFSCVASKVWKYLQLKYLFMFLSWCDPKYHTSLNFLAIISCNSYLIT